MCMASYGADLCSEHVGKAWTMSRPRVCQIPFSSPFPIILLLGGSISMALRLFFCAAHGNCLGSKVHLLAYSGSGRCENEKKEKKIHGMASPKPGWRGTRDIISVSDSSHIQSLKRRLATCFTSPATYPDHFHMSSTFHFILE